VSLGDLAVEQDPDSALGGMSAAPPMRNRRQHGAPVLGMKYYRQRPGRRSVWRKCGKRPRRKNKKSCRSGARASRACRPRGAAAAIRELLPPYPPPWRWGTTRRAGRPRAHAAETAQLCAGRGARQLVGVLTERDVVTKVVATPLDVDHVPLREVMQPDPECLHLDDALVYAFHQMHRGAYRHVPCVDAQRRPTALVSIQAIIDELVAAFPQELLTSRRPRRTHRPTPEGA